MFRTTKKVVIPASFLATSLIVVAVAWGAAAGANGGTPSLTGVTVLAKDGALSAPTGMALSPATPDQAAAAPISAEEALKTAWEQEGAPGDPKEATATFALFSWGENLDTPVWVITYAGACVPQHGPYGSEGGTCLLIPFNTIIDATSGDFLTSFAVSDGGYQVGKSA